jgi:hypothetical protein
LWHTLKGWPPSLLRLLFFSLLLISFLISEVILFFKKRLPNFYRLIVAPPFFGFALSMPGALLTTALLLRIIRQKILKFL